MKYHINTLYIVVSNKLSEMAKFIKYVESTLVVVSLFT